MPPIEQPRAAPSRSGPPGAAAVAVGVAVAVAVLGTALTRACVMRTVGGDGVGYLKAQATGASYPGHLLYVPLLAALRRLTSAPGRPLAVQGLAAARWLSHVSAGVAAGATAFAAVRLDGRAVAGWVAGLGLVASFGLLAAGSDVESYAPALACLALAVAGAAQAELTTRSAWLAAAGLATAAATLLHGENQLFFLPLAALLLRLLGRRPAGTSAWPALAASSLGPLAVAVPYGVALAAHDVGWLLGASHGFAYPLRWTRPLAVLHGAGKALVYAPYPYEAPLAPVIGATALGLIALAVLLAQARRGRAPLGRAFALAWALPYGAVALAFFSSDQERWLFVLPLLWLWVASAPRPRPALVVAALLLAANLLLWLPRARDTSAIARAGAAAAQLRAGDLVVSPGHDWDEQLGLDAPGTPYPLVFHAARLGSRAALAADLARRASQTWQAGGRVVLVRLDGADPSPLGWKELAPLGITPGDAASLLPGRERRPLGAGVELLLPPD